MTGTREAQLLEAANLLLDARRTLTPIADLPAELLPTSDAEVFLVNDLMLQALGPVGGWKVGAGSLTATPGAAPLPLAGIAPSGSVLRGSRLRGLEAEIAFLLGADLPPRPADAPYSDEEVYAAVASCHPVIEVIESALVNPVDPAVRLAKDADIQMHGGLIYGAAYPDWKSVDFHAERVTLAVDGAIWADATGSNTSGNLLRLLPWLANQGARTGGLRAGQWITTGSWTGCRMASAGASVDVHFSTMGMVGLRFE